MLQTWLYGAVRGLLQTANARTGNHKIGLLCTTCSFTSG
jgi:hypothetical protein